MKERKKKEKREKIKDKRKKRRTEARERKEIATDGQLLKYKETFNQISRAGTWTE